MHNVSKSLEGANGGKPAGPMQNYLVISALGKDRPGVLDELSKSILDCGASISESRMTVLGSEFALIMMIGGNWDTIAKFEDMLPRIQKQLDLVIQSRRTEARENAHDLLPYAIDVVSIDHPGIVNDIAGFFATRHINIDEMYTGSYAAAHSGTPMFSLHMNISIPSSASIAALRGEFMDFCDSLNLDSVMEPVK